MAAVVFIRASVEAARLEPGLCHAPGPDPWRNEPEPTPLQELTRAFEVLDPFGSSSGKRVSSVLPVSKRTKGVFDGYCVPEWDTPFWERYGSKIRIGRRGLWEFKGYQCLPRSDDGEEEVRLVEV